MLKSSPVFSLKYVAPTLMAMSCISSCCLYPKLGGATATTLIAPCITFAASVFTKLVPHGDIINSFFFSSTIGFNTLVMLTMLFISMSATNTITSSNTHSSFFTSLMNNGLKYPLSIFNPFVISAYVSLV